MYVQYVIIMYGKNKDILLKFLDDLPEKDAIEICFAVNITGRVKSQSRSHTRHYRVTIIRFH